MTVDYKKLCADLFGTTDVNKLKEISLSVNNKSSVGRKKLFNEKQVKEMKEMQSHNIPQQKIAEHFGTTRQTISKYLANTENDDYGLQIDYMYKRSVCTTIFVNFKAEKIKVINKTDDILHRAFGVNENPSWSDLYIFLADRCFPKFRGDRKAILNTLNVDGYDPLQIVEKTRGKTYEDRQWMKFKYRSNSYGTN